MGLLGLHRMLGVSSSGRLGLGDFVGSGGVVFGNMGRRREQRDLFAGEVGDTEGPEGWMLGG